MAAEFIVGLRQHIAEQDSEGNLTDAKVEMAKEGVAIARAKAPVDEGDYRDGIQVGRRGASGVGVEFTDWKSRLIEYGTQETPEYAVAAKTAEQLKQGR
ncbi:HK97 gp10 family phage protein [Mycolicibacterium gilvum]|uniref:HK97 gp10 family phage protein n=1 Tax=Mycolicibacterium gilvum TaxID=1804 RepID=UPI0040454C06